MSRPLIPSRFSLIIQLELRMIPIETSFITVDTERASDLDDAMARMSTGDAGYRYSVAWIDCLAGGSRLGRSVLMRGDHATAEELPARRRRAPLVPPRQALLFGKRAADLFEPGFDLALLRRLRKRQVLVAGDDLGRDRCCVRQQRVTLGRGRERAIEWPV